jgi:hypothetical protein
MQFLALTIVAALVVAVIAAPAEEVARTVIQGVSFEHIKPNPRNRDVGLTLLCRSARPPSQALVRKDPVSLAPMARTELAVKPTA